MDYALIEDGIVVNIIALHPMNASEFVNAVPMNDLQIAIGDTYVDGKFYRNGEEVTLYPTYNNKYNIPDRTIERIKNDAIIEVQQEVSK